MRYKSLRRRILTICRRYLPCRFDSPHTFNLTKILDQYIAEEFDALEARLAKENK